MPTAEIKEALRCRRLAERCMQLASADLDEGKADSLRLRASELLARAQAIEGTPGLVAAAMRRTLGFP